MKKFVIAILLGLSIAAVPVVYHFFGPSLGTNEWKVLRTLLYIVSGVALYCFLVGEITHNNSQVDKFWSILPVIYVWIVAGYGHFTPRLVIMAVLVTLWGIRLTTNFALKGAYHWRFWTGKEDYRWQVLRDRSEFQPHWKWMLFNLLFICLYQNVLILLFTLPALIAYQFVDTPLGWLDYVAAGLVLFFIIYEMIADIQQWNFQSKKWAMINNGQELAEPFKRGFLTSGLWAYSRHPNYFGEQAIWFCFYLFSIAAGASIFNWSIIGALLLIVLFQGSSNFGEEISSGKYPEYKEYQRTVSKFIPLPRRRK